MEEEIKVINEVCQERGHVMSNGCFSTAMYCPPRVEDTECHTVIVYPACNTLTYRCSRCGETVKEKEKERKVFKWKSKDCIH